MNNNEILETFKKAKDVIIKENKELSFVIVFQEELADIKQFTRDYLQRMMENKASRMEDLFTGVVEEIKETEKNIDDISSYIFLGDIIMIKDNMLYRFKLNNIPASTIEESSADSTNILGSKDGFNENIKTNMGLLRTRIKEYDLCINEFVIGKRSKTKVNLLSIKDIANDKTKNEIIKKMKEIDIDSVLNIFDVINGIVKEGFVPKTAYTGSPDIAAKALLDGRFVIMMDRIPIVIIVPTALLFLSKIREEVESPMHYSIFVRTMVIISIFLSIFALGIFASLITYQSSSLSLLLLSNLKINQRGIIFPVIIEMIFTLFLFEMYNLIGYRASSFTLKTVIVVIGGILIGQNTINSGLIGVISLSITTICYLTTYIISNDLKVGIMISYLRLFILLSSIVFGLLGVTLASILVIYFLYHQTSFNIGFLHPFSPISFKDLKIFFYPRSSILDRKRPQALKPKNQEMKG